VKSSGFAVNEFDTLRPITARFAISTAISSGKGFASETRAKQMSLLQQDAGRDAATPDSWLRHRDFLLTAMNGGAVRSSDHAQKTSVSTPHAESHK
jgi:hypothetical protein